MRYLIILTLVGCTWFDPRNTVENYECSAEQQKVVEEYVKECKGRVCSPMPYCKNKAIINRCEYIGEDVNP